MIYMWVGGLLIRARSVMGSAPPLFCAMCDVAVVITSIRFALHDNNLVILRDYMRSFLGIIQDPDIVSVIPFPLAFSSFIYSWSSCSVCMYVCVYVWVCFATGNSTASITNR